jgi:hypothetical protein
LDSGSGTSEEADACATCLDSTALVGTSDLEGGELIQREKGSAFAYGYSPRSSGVARAISIYFGSTPNGPVELGVWSDNAQRPAGLLASARLYAPQTGWNRVPLDRSVSVTVGSVVWIGFLALGGDVFVRLRSDSTSALQEAYDCCIPRLDDPYVIDARNDCCDLRAFLSP